MQNCPTKRLADWLDKGRFFNYKRHQVFYREGGAGETLLLIHGFPTASWDWHLVWEQLTRHFHVIAPDMIGFGFSDKPRNYHYDIMDQADLHETMLSKMGVRRCHILAHDYGDTVAQELLARWLLRRDTPLQGLTIQSVTLLNGGIFPEMHRPRVIQKILASPFGAMLTPLMGKRQLTRTFKNIFGKNTQPTADEMTEYWHLVARNKGKYRIPQLIRYMEQRRTHRERWVGALEKCPLPLWHINGEADPISGRHAGSYLEKKIPQAHVRFLPEIGHYPQVEAPQEVLLHFLQAMEKAGR